MRVIGVHVYEFVIGVCACRYIGVCMYIGMAVCDRCVCVIGVRVYVHAYRYSCVNMCACEYVCMCICVRVHVHGDQLGRAPGENQLTPPEQAERAERACWPALNTTAAAISVNGPISAANDRLQAAWSQSTQVYTLNMGTQNESWLLESERNVRRQGRGAWSPWRVGSLPTVQW